MERSLKNTENDEKRKHLKREIKLILIFAFILFIALTLATFNPHDPTFFTRQVFPEEKINNFFGSFGANLAAVLIQIFGLAAYFIPFYLLSVVVYSKLLKEFSLNTPRFIFFILSLFSLAAVLSGIQDSASVFGLKLPLGGFFGLIIAETLARYLNSTGGFFVSLLSFVVFTILALEKNIFKKIFSLLLVVIKKFSTLSAFKSKSAKVESRPPKVVKPLQKKEEKETIVEPKVDITTFIKSGKMSLPPISLLNINKEKYTGPGDAEIKENSNIIEECLKHFDIKVTISEVHPGPIITMYEIIPDQGTKISKIISLEHELSMALKAISLRIIAPIPGKSSIGVEVSNKKLATVYVREIIGSEEFDNKGMRIPLCLGKNTTGEPYVADLVKMPHLLVAGATGSGKSVSLNVMILSILYKMMPDEAKLIMIDPKMLELNFYSDIPHLLYPVVTSPEDAAKILKWAIKEMERRYELMAGASVRNIEQYNAKISEKGQKALFSESEAEEKKLPYIIIIIDELADLMMVAAKEVETYITRLAQKARAAGIHMIVATQRPSVDVITGLIKANFPARVAFKVASKIDSRTILDANGADSLLGQGDMLFLRPGTSNLVRIHGAFVTEAEIESVVNFWKAQGKPEYIELPEDGEESFTPEDEYDDEKYLEAVKIVRETRQASISHLQRRMRIGYNRAARLIERMEKDGIVTPSEGGKPREVIF